MDKIPLTELMKGPYSPHRCIKQQITTESLTTCRKFGKTASFKMSETTTVQIGDRSFVLDQEKAQEANGQDPRVRHGMALREAQQRQRQGHRRSDSIDNVKD